MHPRRLAVSTAVLACLALAACAGPQERRVPPTPAAASATTSTAVAASPATAAGKPTAVAAATSPVNSNDPSTALAWLDRVTWGASPADYARLRADGRERWLQQQLQSGPDDLPPEVAARIASLTIEQEPLPALVYRLQEQHRAAEAITDEETRKAAVQAWQQEMNRLDREAASRFVLRALYSRRQLQEELTWFWFNHFNVHQHKGLIRPMLGDYEQGLRRHALGRFRDLLAASVRHPAMLVYLDNAQNAAGHANENYARELMELHTLGVDGGYSQRDVQELARVLTGFGVNFTDPASHPPPRLRPERAGQYVRDGVLEFHPNRHDFGDKELLGHVVRGRGAAELDQVIDLLARQPATARHVSRQLARFFAADEPPPELIEAMARTFLRTDGDIAAVLRTMFTAPSFTASLHARFKDPLHYVLSAVRLAYDTRPILNTGPIINWLNRMGEGLYNRSTPDGYPLADAAWSGPGQLALRFEIAKGIGGGSAGLFRGEGPEPAEQPAFPQLANELYYEAQRGTLSPATRQALDQAASPQEWNLMLLSSPEFMRR